MRPPLQAARDQLATLLARLGPVAAPVLAQALGVSVPTLHRMLPDLGGALQSGGRARRARYALRRALDGANAAMVQPVHAVDAQGRAELLGELALLQPQGSFLLLAGSDWPLREAARDGWWVGLPYPLQDMRPQGYLGRQFARRWSADLGLAPDPREWNDADDCRALARHGSDASGNLIVGSAAFDAWQAQRRAPPAPLPVRGLLAAYGELAELAVGAGVPGSSAAGEFPKFPALREAAGRGTPHVLVKFSGPGRSAAEQRWADLLVCEHLALETLGGSEGAAGSGDAAGASPMPVAARSRILQAGAPSSGRAGRTFLEVERFDRHGTHGRSPLVSLATLNAELVGEATSDWTRLASRLAGLGLLAADALATIERWWTFGRLIANTDMHTGNLSFRPQAGRLLPAPVYDMLPMLYAPLPGGEVPQRQFEPPLPLPAQRPLWLEAAALAREFWWRAAADGRISEDFRRLCADNGQRLDEAAAHA